MRIMNYQLLYSTTLLVSFVLTLILYLYHRRYWNPASHFPLQMIYFLNMSSALLCVVWVIVDGVQEWSIINYIGNIIEFNCMGYCGYFWLSYCLKFVDIPTLKTQYAKFLLALPVVVVMILIITTPLTHWAFYIDEQGYFQRGTYYFMQQTGYLYLLASSFICLWYRKRCETTSERNRLTVLSMFPLSPAFFGGIQIIAPSGFAPTLQFSILISLILVFVDELDQKITRDSLTQLTNRYEFEQILQNKMKNRIKSHEKLYVLMADLDDFKSINDTYGHQQGDAVLMMVGSVLGVVSSKYHTVAARMSGDEFISFIETEKYETVEEYRKDVQQALFQAGSHLPYDLSLSIGIAAYDGNMSMMQLLNLADQNMYAQKKLHKHRKENQHELYN